LSAGYKAVQWNAFKIWYDVALLCGVALYLAAFRIVAPLIGASARRVSPEILAMRGYGSCAFLMLAIILCIGPLARLDRRFLPLLYNRRHFGVATFCVALLHAWSVVWYHQYGVVPPLVSLLASSDGYASVARFPFEPFGLGALVILLVMAATSHDFWLKFLDPPVWKSIHLMVYVGFGLLVLHVALGALQAETVPLWPPTLAACLALVGGLHLATGWREWRRDGEPVATSADGWIDVGPVDAIPENGAIAVRPPNGERIAIFRYDGCIAAVSDVCAHQNGPLSEGRMRDGCITCPWHGYQYRPEDGCSPPPFTERIATYPVRIEGGRIRVSPVGLPPGTYSAPAAIDAGEGAPR
jgi:nitrite reductase/ring-hydroxylating ferredoxin subunit/DMSO/TMAO reductase YedYZ heme-binding membrane subunit